MKRLAKHQPERLDSIVGFACACSMNCGCTCECISDTCTCTCTGGTQAFESSYNSSLDYQSSKYLYNTNSSYTYNTTYSGASSNISVWG